VLQQQGDPPAAEASFRRALALNPDSADAWNGLGTALFDARRYVDAEAAYREALARRPDLVESLCNLAELMHIRGRTEEARSTWERALALRPSDVEALNGLARLAIDRGDFAEADTRIRLALKHHPRHARSWINLAMAQKHSSLEDAEQSLREALQLEPGNAVARYNLAAILLVRDDYGNGFALYESRFDTFTQEFAGSRGLYEELRDGTWWRGGRLDGKHLLIWTEQGLGDAVMTMRYLPLLRSRGVSRVTVACSLPLACILGTVAGVDTVILIDRRPLPAFDVHCSLMSLPGLFETTHATVPASVPYLVVPADTAAVWEARVAGSDSRRIGICWAGNPLLKDDQRRSIYLSAFAPCFEVAGCDWISLQKDEPARATSAGTPIATEWIADCDDLMDTAALIDRLDLVITVDTVIAHLAGALGKPVWMLNRHRGDWRWGLTGMETPWYPTMEVVRQRPDEDWREVIERMNVQLKHFAGESA
jgi:Flp pilus assembly protein TadD